MKKLLAYAAALLLILESTAYAQGGGSGAVGGPLEARAPAWEQRLTAWWTAVRAARVPKPRNLTQAFPPRRIP